MAQSFELEWYRSILDHLEALSGRVDALSEKNTGLEIKIGEMNNLMNNLISSTGRLSEAIEGNAKPGLKERVTELENDNKSKKKIMNLVYGTLGVVIITQVWNWIVDAVNLINSHTQ